MRPPRHVLIGCVAQGALGVGLRLLAGVGPVAAAPAPTPPFELMRSGESCAMRAEHAPDCLRDLAGSLVAYLRDPEARVAWWRTTAWRLGFISRSRPEGKRPVFAVLAVGDLAWPAFWGPGQNVPGDRGLIFRIDVRTARVSSLGGTRAEPRQAGARSSPDLSRLAPVAPIGAAGVRRPAGSRGACGRSSIRRPHGGARTWRGRGWWCRPAARRPSDRPPRPRPAPGPARASRSRP
ncbi:MAG: hypothetical protein QOD86_97 [Miltoncostaeaceae bacterium]|nr:hypothetical protein [Miltoncostaeaceae bacterium]